MNGCLSFMSGTEPTECPLAVQATVSSVLIVRPKNAALVARTQLWVGLYVGSVGSGDCG
jgi:hypothetical protein